MRLTDFTDHAVRVLMYLALEDHGLASTGEIADRYGISRSHLTKIAWTLGRGGFIDTVRGRGGGLKLARPARAISVGEVARHMERTILFSQCFAEEPGACRISPCCPYKRVLTEAEEAFYAVLDRFTIEDLVRRNCELRAVLFGAAP